MDNVKCEGHEMRLIECDYADTHDCGSEEGAGVVCDTRDYSDILNSTCFELDISYEYGSSLDQKSRVASALECQKICLQHEECTYFTYYPDLQR